VRGVTLPRGLGNDEQLTSLAAVRRWVAAAHLADMAGNCRDIGETVRSQTPPGPKPFWILQRPASGTTSAAKWHMSGIDHKRSV